MLFDGVDVMRLSETQKAIYRLNPIGMIRQDLALLPHRTALDNVIVPLLLQGGLSKRGALDRRPHVASVIQVYAFHRLDPARRALASAAATWRPASP